MYAVRAFCLIRKEPFYRRNAFEQGLKRVGFTLINDHFIPKSNTDFLIIWNKKRGAEETMADEWQRRGGMVIVTENGYLQRVDKTYYAISVNGHNGSGWWPMNLGEDRFSKLGFDLKPWRTFSLNGYRLVCGQRSIGSSLMASPPQWAEKKAAELSNRGFSVRLRPHPGNFAPKIPLEKDLAGANECFIWSSGAGVRALVEGVPVHYSAPHWICEDGSSEGRTMVLNRMAHAQWHHEEISTGEPFKRILNDSRITKEK